MRKILLSLLFFVFACANAWGAIYTHDYNANIQGSFNTSTKTLTITGSGQIPDLAAGGTNFYSSNNDNVEKVVIGEGITWIGRYILQDYTNLTSITFPSTLTRIRNYNFDKAKKIVEIHAYSPNQWAQVEIFATSGHPFGTISSLPSGVAEARSYYFNGSATATTDLVFTPGLTEIKDYTFYNSGTFNSVSIPSTVTDIGSYALASKFTYVYVNRSTPPTLGSANSLTYGSSASKSLYVPSGAKSAYNVSSTFWVYGMSYNTTAPAANKIYEKPVSGTVDGQSWSLSASGVLTINGSGALTTTFVNADGATQYPYYYFRYLVNKVVVTGGITGLSNILQQCAAVREVDIDQAKVPTASATLPTLIHGGTIALNVNPAALADASGSNLGSTPWTNAKFGNVTLSSAVSIADNAECETLLANIHNYVDEPFDLQITRSLTNAQYNTFCSPVPMSASDISSKLGGADIRTLEGSSLEDDVLTLSFSENTLSEIEAGVPYLIQPANNVDNITFTDVDPSSIEAAGETTETPHAYFIGVLAPTPLTGGNKNTLFLGADNELFWPEADGNIGGMRAYFSVKEAAQKNGIKARIVMNKEVATDIESISDEGLPVTGKKILRNGQLFIIRDGKEYNLMGIMMK